MDEADCRELLRSWTEIVGRLEQWGEGTITLSVRKILVIPVGDEDLERWESMLQRGSKIGVLILDDGRIRVRSLERRDER